MSGPVWTARTGPASPSLLAYSASIREDAAMLRWDVAGSIAHVQALALVGLLAGAEAEALRHALCQALAEHEAGAWQMEDRLEDGHMNLEAWLIERLGAVGQKVHTGRSRNDQVATAITLHARADLAQGAQLCLATAAALAQAAAAHAEVPWVARTHGEPAQAASLGLLFAAHAWRFHDAAKRALDAFHHVGECALGSGAVAGSTLPLDASHAAALLGLRPLRNALLATGTRDQATASLAAWSAVGAACAGLAQDLLDLVQARAVALPPGMTTGSSLMPHKRNPDALELARAHGIEAAGHEAAVRALTTGKSLGYHRDFQAVKPHLVECGSRGVATLGILAECVRGMVVRAEAMAPAAAEPALAATDAAEALVAAGMPFRVAYTHVATAFQAMESGVRPKDALAAAGLDAKQVALCLDALQPDPMRRRTLGASGDLPRQLADLDDALEKASTRAAAAAGDVARVAALLVPEVLA